MGHFYINLSGLSNARALHNKIETLAMDVYPIAGKPHQYEVIWEPDEPITSLIPELPSERIFHLT